MSEHGTDGRDGRPGQAGAPGAPGREGEQGRPGVAGPVGHVGAEGPSPAVSDVAAEVRRHQVKLTDRRLLVLYVLLAVAAVLYGARLTATVRQVDRNTRTVAATQQAQQETRWASDRADADVCATTAKQLTALRVFAQEQRETERSNPFSVGAEGEKLKARRIASYQQLIDASKPIACPPQAGR